MPQHRLLLLLGGHYHDFAGFESFLRGLVEPDGFDLRATYDSAHLHELREFDGVVLYTCHVDPPDAPGDGLRYAAGISDAETSALTSWVRGGGGLVGAHSATTIRPDNDELRRLLGGRFVSHPPRFPFTIYPMQRSHPVTNGVEPFTIIDELYTQDYGDVDVHAVAIDRGTAHPMVWTRTEGEGRVVHVAPGHDARVWAGPGYRILMRQAIDWSTGNPSAPE